MVMKNIFYTFAVQFLITLLLASVSSVSVGAQENPNHTFFSGNFSNHTVIGNRLPGTWRPFSDDSPFNTPISSSETIDPNSANVISFMNSAASNLRFTNSYMPAIWVVNSNNVEKHLLANTASPFDIWDPTHNRESTVKVPIDSTMWGEQTSDGHIGIIDPFHMMMWDMSRYRNNIQNPGDRIDSSTFNVWDLTGKGTGDPNEGWRSGARGSRGSGFSSIAGLIRPEEIQAGEIRHALVFTFDEVRHEDLGFYYPACRSDGTSFDANAPAEGMRFRLNPNLNNTDFDAMGLSDAAKIVAKALQVYGMYLADSGGDMALQLQLLDPDSSVHRQKWDQLAPGLYRTITNIPTDEFELMQTGPVLHRDAQNITTTPLIQPVSGDFTDPVMVTITEHKAWPDANIYYTLDGSEPTEDSILYTGPFTLTNSATVLARAYDYMGGLSNIPGGGGASHIMRASFGIAGYQLSLTSSSGGVIESTPAQALYNNGAAVVLTAIPETGMSFTGWSGDLTGSGNPATIIMDGNKSVTASFSILPPNPVPTTYTLNRTTLGSGNISLTPSGGIYDSGTIVTITATASAGHVFTGWSGDLSGSSNPISVTMNANKNIIANFSPFTTNIKKLPIVSASSAKSYPNKAIDDNIKSGWSAYYGGSIELDLGKSSMLTGLGIVWYPGSGNRIYNYTIELSNDGLSWVEVFTGQTPRINDFHVEKTDFYETAARYVKITGTQEGGNKYFSINEIDVFGVVENQLSLTQNINGLGSIVADPADGFYDPSTIVTVTALAKSGYKFTGWSGDLTGSANSASITMDSNKNIIANFVPATTTINELNIVSASSDKSYPNKAIDNKIKSGWSAYNGGSIELDLGENKMLSELGIVWYPGSGNRIYNYTVEVSSDGENWVKVFIGQTSLITDFYVETTHFAEIAARYVKITGTQEGGNKYFSINEINVMGIENDL